MYTILNKLRSYSPCKGGWLKLLKSLNKAAADGRLAAAAAARQATQEAHEAHLRKLLCQPSH